MNRSLSTLLFFIALISMTNALKKLKQTPVAEKSKFVFTVDDNLENVSLNGETIAFNYSNAAARDWRVVKTIEFDSLYGGDEISVTFNDNNNRAGLIGHLTYITPRGKTYNLYTDEQWVCGDKAAVIIPAQDIHNAKLGALGTVAKWVSTRIASNKDRVTCKYIVPCIN